MGAHKIIMPKNKKNLIYMKPKRFPIGKIIESKKDKYLSLMDAKKLLNWEVAVEEKLDGKFTIFQNDKYVFFAEDMYTKHSIYYRVPGRYAIFDIYDKERKLLLKWETKTSITLDIRKGKIRIPNPNNRAMYINPKLFFPVPLIDIGLYDMKELSNLIGISAYAINDEDKNKHTWMEGIVVKIHRDLFLVEHMAGKLVRIEFTEGITDNYLRKEEVRNIIDPKNTPIIISYNEKYKEIY